MSDSLPDGHSVFIAERERRLAAIEREHAGNLSHRDLPRADTLLLAGLTAGSFVVVLLAMAL